MQSFADDTSGLWSGAMLKKMSAKQTFPAGKAVIQLLVCFNPQFGIFILLRVITLLRKGFGNELSGSS